MKLKHFNIDEFDSPDISNSGINMDNEFLQMLDNARQLSSVPFKINSGYRSKEHNAKVGGKEKSSHLIGKAVDISCNGSRERHIILTSLIKAGFTRFGIGNTFIHTDNDNSKSQDVIWTY